LLTGYFHEKATKAVSDAYWKARYEAIYGNMSAIMDKLSDEECAFILSQLNCNQMNAYKMMVDIADQMDIVRTFIKTKQDAIELARKMPDIVYLERHKEGMQKGYDGARLQNYIYFPHLLWDGKIINFYSMLLMLQTEFCSYLAKMYDGKVNAEDIAMINRMKAVSDEYFAYADTYKFAENISPASKTRIIAISQKLHDTLCIMGIVKMEIPSIITDGIDNAINLAARGGKMGTIYVLSRNSYKYANAIVDLYESNGFVCRAVDNHGSIEIVVSWNY